MSREPTNNRYKSVSQQRFDCSGSFFKTNRLLSIKVSMFVRLCILGASMAISITHHYPVACRCVRKGIIPLVQIIRRKKRRTSPFWTNRPMSQTKSSRSVLGTWFPSNGKTTRTNITKNDYFASLLYWSLSSMTHIHHPRTAICFVG